MMHLIRHHVLTYLDDERLNVLVNQRRRRGASIGEATSHAVTVLWKLDRPTTLRQQAGTENA